jgi:hypothetical protein
VREHRRQRPQRVHAVDRRQRPHRTQEGIGQDPRRGKRRLQIAELRSSRQAPVPQQIADLLERGATLGVGQIVNVAALIGQDAASAVQETDGGLPGDDVFQAGFGRDLGGHNRRTFRRSGQSGPRRSGVRRGTRTADRPGRLARAAPRDSRTWA